MRCLFYNFVSFYYAFDNFAVKKIIYFIYKIQDITYMILSFYFKFFFWGGGGGGEPPSHFKEVSIPSQESNRSCKSVRGVDFAFFSTIFYLISQLFPMCGIFFNVNIYHWSISKQKLL